MELKPATQDGSNPEETAPLPQGLAATFNNEYLDYKAKAAGRLASMQKWNNAYLGRYDFVIPDDQSNVYPKMTRVFVSAAMAKLIEVLMPSNGDNPWEIYPTPIPDMPVVDVVDPNTGEPVQITAKDIMSMAKAACDGMTRRFEDNFVEMQLESQLVDALLDLTVFGTMVWLGPFQDGKPSLKWQADMDRLGRVGMKKMAINSGPRPKYIHIPLQNFFPDPYVKNIEDAYSAWSHAPVGKQTLHKMARDKKFKSDVIYEYLATNPTGDWDAADADADFMTAAGQDNLLGGNNKFLLKERYGFVDAQTLIDEGMIKPDMSPHATFFCHTIMLGQEIIYFTMEGMEFYEYPPFTVTPYEQKIGSMFGRGVPEQMDDPQSVTGSLVRAMVDNLAFGVAPLTEMDVDLIDPNQNISQLRPRQVILRKQKSVDSPNPNPAVRFTEVPVLMEKILPALGYFKELMQLQTSLPFATMNMSDQASGIRTIGQQTAIAKAMEGFIRLVITNLDQKWTIKILQTMYDWEMSYNPDASIKGDFKIIAKGVKGALARETMTQRRIDIMQIAATSPALAERMKPNSFVEAINRDLGIEDDDFFISEQEYQQIQQQIAANKSADIAAQAEARRFSAETPVKDLLVQLATSNKETGSKSWAAQQAAAYRALGEKDEQLYATLSSMAEDQAKLMSPDQASTVMNNDFQPPTTNKSAKPDSPGEESAKTEGVTDAGMMPEYDEDADQELEFGAGATSSPAPPQAPAPAPEPKAGKKRKIKFNYDDTGRVSEADVEEA